MDRCTGPYSSVSHIGYLWRLKRTLNLLFCIAALKSHRQFEVGIDRVTRNIKFCYNLTFNGINQSGLTFDQCRI